MPIENQYVLIYIGIDIILISSTRYLVVSSGLCVVTAVTFIQFYCKHPLPRPCIDSHCLVYMWLMICHISFRAWHGYQSNSAPWQNMILCTVPQFHISFFILFTQAFTTEIPPHPALCHLFHSISFLHFLLLTQLFTCFIHKPYFSSHFLDSLISAPSAYLSFFIGAFSFIGSLSSCTLICQSILFPPSLLPCTPSPHPEPPMHFVDWTDNRAINQSNDAPQPGFPAQHGLTLLTS